MLGVWLCETAGCVLSHLRSIPLYPNPAVLLAYVTDLSFGVLQDLKICSGHARARERF